MSLPSVLPARLLLALLAGALVSSGCASSPRPDPTGSATAIPAEANPITNVTWTEVALPAAIGSQSMFYGAAGGPKGFVIVGDTGALGFRGLVLRSTDGQTWELVDDNNITPWSLEEVIAMDSGYIAIGGNFGSGPTGWSSAILTSSDGRAGWSAIRASHQSSPSRRGERMPLRPPKGRQSWSRMTREAPGRRSSDPMWVSTATRSARSP